jgi:hypothetical protein
VAFFCEYDNEHPGSATISVGDSQKTVPSLSPRDKIKLQMMMFNPNQLHLYAV